MQTHYPAPSEEEGGTKRTWGIIAGIAAAFLIWGFLIYFLIGDKGPPQWDYGVIADIPGESAYSTHTTPYRPGGLTPDLQPERVDPQHVSEPTSKTQPMEVPK